MTSDEMRELLTFYGFILTGTESDKWLAEQCKWLDEVYGRAFI
jgi:hypothetical protein